MAKVRTISIVVLVFLALGFPGGHFYVSAEESGPTPSDPNAEVTDELIDKLPTDEESGTDEDLSEVPLLENENPASELQIKEKGPSKPKPKMGDYKSGFRRLCQAMRDDGRLEPFYDLLYWSKGFDPECLACKPFFETFSSACTPPTKKKESPGHSQAGAEKVSEGGEGQANSAHETPLPETPRQREPNVRVIANLSQVFSLMAENQKDLPENIKAVRRLLYLLKDPEDPTKGQLEYYSILSHYILAPFKAYEERLERESARGDLGGGDTKLKSADPSTFDF